MDQSTRLRRFYDATNAGITGEARRLYCSGEISWEEAKELVNNPTEDFHLEERSDGWYVVDDFGERRATQVEIILWKRCL